MNSELLLMPTQYMGENCGITAIIFGLDGTINYNKIFIYLKNDKENAIEVSVDEYDTLQTTSATFNNLQINRYYTIVAELQYNGVTQTIESKMPAQETLMFSISLLSNEESGNGGQPTGSEVEKPSKRPTLSNYRSISPTYTSIKNQGSYGTCVANSLSTAMSIFKAQATDMLEGYSVSYIFGSDGMYDNEWMYFEEAIDLCREYGSPRWEFYRGLKNDDMPKNEAINKFKGSQINSILTENAKKQIFYGYERVNFYDCDTVADYIETYGYFMFNFKIPNNFYSVGSDGIVPQPGGTTTYRYVGGSSSTDNGANHSIALIGLTKKNGIPYWIAQNSWGYSWGQQGICFIPLDWGYDSSEYWALDSYGVIPGRYYDAEHPQSVSNIEAYQSGDKEVTLSWDSNETNASYAVFARQKYTEQWFCKYIATDGSTIVTISVDEYNTEYEFMVITMKDSYCSYQSLTVECYVVYSDFTIKDLEVFLRIENGLSFRWTRSTGVTGYNYRLVSNWDGYEISGSVTKNSVDIRAKDHMDWHYGTTHTFYVQAYSDLGVGEWYSLSPITTQPHNATDFTISQSNGYISGSFEVGVATNATHIRLRLYSTDTSTWDEFIEEIEYNVIGNQTPSGSYRFNFQCENGVEYEVYLWVVLKFSDIGMSPDCDGLMELKSAPNYASITINISDKPSLWEWTQEYESVNGTTTISATAYIPVDETGFHPITAVEWNGFTERINEVRAYLSQFYSRFSTEYSFTTVYGASNGYSDNPTVFTFTIYNEVVNAINDLSYYSGTIRDINTISSGTKITASLFTNLSDQLNYLIEQL